MQVAVASVPALPKTAPFGETLPDRSLPEAAPVGSVRVLAKDEEVFSEGDRAAFFYKVISGAVRTSKLLTDGRRQIDAFHLPGDMFGIEAVSSVAVGPAKIVAYRRCSLETLASGNGAFTRQIVEEMMRSLERAQNHMLLLGRKNAMEKVATFLLDLAERAFEDDHVDLPMSRSDIADHLGLTIETVSRSLTQLERERVIEVPAHRRTIVLPNKRVLRRLDS